MGARISTLRQRGFTLLEIMVATMILGLVMMSVYGVVARTLIAKTHAEERAELYASGREAVLRVADDIEGALPPTAGLGIHFVGIDMADRVPTDAVQFTVNIRRTNSSSQSRGGRAIVSYSLDPLPGSPGLYALRRQEELLTQAPEQEDAALDPEAAAAAAAQPEATGAYVMDRVAGLSLRYLDPLGGSFVDAWDTTQEPEAGQAPIGLPAAVQITLFLADVNGVPYDFSTIVDLPLMTVPPTPGPASAPVGIQAGSGVSG